MFRFEALPADVLAQLLRFLSGFDLLPLSHVSRRLYYDVLAPNGAVWASRLPSRSFLDLHGDTTGAVRSRASSSRRWKSKYKKIVGEVKGLVRSLSIDSAVSEQARTWKRLYFASSSLRFPGCAPGVVAERRSGGAIQLWDGLHHAWNADAFSFDMWFALLPKTKTSVSGGILFAAQGTEWPGVKYGDDAQQFVHADTDGNLFCSMLTETEIVASRLETHRWYHVAASFERLPEDWWMARQLVYLNGKLVHQAEGSVYRRWRFLNHAQLGSGVICGQAPGSPSPEHRGWYGFNGVIDDFRFWHGIANPDQVDQLFRGQEDSATAEDTLVCSWSVKREPSLCFYGTNVHRTRSTRPREKSCNLTGFHGISEL